MQNSTFLFLGSHSDRCVIKVNIMTKYEFILIIEVMR